MALINYSHVFAGAGFSGETWDITQGFNRSFSSVAGDLDFANTGSTLTLTAGTFPSWLAEVGVKFTVSGTTSNDGTYTVVSLDGTSKILTVKEALADETPVGVSVLDGSAEPDIQDILLSAGDGALTEDTPHVLTSTGALGAARTLDISGMENESSGRGGLELKGRFFYLSIQNSDISSTNTITISGSTSINGNASYAVQNTGDYIFHYTSDGVWLVNILPRPSEQVATLKRITFAATDWDAGANNNEITVIQTGTPAAGQVGPHSLAAYESYMVQVINTDLPQPELVDVEIQFASNGDITMKKARQAGDFNGIMIIAGTLD